MGKRGEVMRMSLFGKKTYFFLPHVTTLHSTREQQLLFKSYYNIKIFKLPGEKSSQLQLFHTDFF
jgi:hypothetical protein